MQHHRTNSQRPQLRSCLTHCRHGTPNTRPARPSKGSREDGCTLAAFRFNPENTSLSFLWPKTEPRGRGPCARRVAVRVTAARGWAVAGAGAGRGVRPRFPKTRGSRRVETRFPDPPSAQPRAPPCPPRPLHTAPHTHAWQRAATPILIRLPGALWPRGWRTGGRAAARTGPAVASRAQARNNITVGGGAGPQGAAAVLFLGPSAQASSRPVGSLGLVPHPQGQTARPRGDLQRKAGRPAGPGPRVQPGCQAPCLPRLTTSLGTAGSCGVRCADLPGIKYSSRNTPNSNAAAFRVSRPWGWELKIDRKLKNR